MEARIALASVIVFGGVLAAGMLVSRADGGENSASRLANSSQEAVVALAPQELPETQTIASTTGQPREDSPTSRWDDDDWDDDDHDEEHDDDDDWDDDDRDDHDHGRDERDDDDD